MMELLPSLKDAPSSRITSVKGMKQTELINDTRRAWLTEGEEVEERIAGARDDDVTGSIGLEEDPTSIVMMMMPSTFNEPEDEGEDEEDAEIWPNTASTSFGFLLNETVEPLLLEEDDDEDMEKKNELFEQEERAVASPKDPQALVDTLMPVEGNNALVLGSGKKRRGRKPSLKRTEKKPKRPPPSEAKARLRNYERRSRHKREQGMLTMKEIVKDLECQITAYCKNVLNIEDESKRRDISELALEAITLNHQNYHLRRALDDHRFFHSMLQLEYDHRETPASPSDSVASPSWRPLDEEMCWKFIRDSYLEIDQFANSEDFVTSGLEICGWREKRKLCGQSVNFLFHKKFAKDCSDDLAQRSWEMRAVQDQVTRYFGPCLSVKVEIIQRITNDVVVVRRKITHTTDGWVHHTIYLLFRTKTPDGHLVCIRDMNPEDTRDFNYMLSASDPGPSSSNCVIWASCFIWWKFTALPPEPGKRQGGFEVEYGGSLSSATADDAAFWMREVLILALRWENIIVGPLLTL